MLAGRLFQVVGAAVRKPRVPNDKLHRVTDNRLAEADRKVLHGVWRWRRQYEWQLIETINEDWFVVQRLDR